MKQQMKRKKNQPIDRALREDKAAKWMMATKVGAEIVAIVLLATALAFSWLICEPVWMDILVYAVMCGAALVCALISVNVDCYCGAYKCKKCGNVHVPTERVIANSFGFFRSRYIRCPECGKRSWNKKTFDLKETEIAAQKLPATKKN